MLLYSKCDHNSATIIVVVVVVVVVVVGASPGVVAGAVAAVEETSQVEPRRDEPNLGKSGERLTNGFGYFCDRAHNWLKPDL